MKYSRNIAKAGLNLSQYVVATQGNINSRFCSVVEIKLSLFLKGGHLPKSSCMFWTKIILRYNRTLNFYVNHFRNRTLRSYDGLVLKYCTFSYLIDF